MQSTSGTSPTQPSHFVADPDGARSEADGLSRHSATGPATNTEPDVQADSAPTPRAGRIVVGVDGSEASLRALAKAVDLAGALNTELQIVTTWKHVADYADIGVSDWSPERDAREILTDAVGRHFGGTVPEWVTGSSLEGSATQRLIDVSNGAEMLVVGSRGHGGVVGLMLGSVSSNCAEKAHCPVLVVH